MAVRVAGGTSLTVATLRSADKAAMLRGAVAWVTSQGRDLTNTIQRIDIVIDED